ncbi:hypothetical protein AAMO2058_000798500 [Amorphochlora amoebiformis]
MAALLFLMATLVAAQKPPIRPRTSDAGPTTSIIARRGFAAILPSFFAVAIRRADANAGEAGGQGAAKNYGLLSGDKLRGCNSPNCLSTNSKSADTYLSAWRAKSTSTSDTATDIIKAMYQIEPSSKLSEERTTAKGEYIRFEVPSPTGVDDVEFLVKTEGVPERSFDGDFPGNLVLFRSLERNPRYIYPFQTPIGDLGRQKKRLVAVRDTIGARVVGCELLECYDVRLTGANS